MKTVTKHIYSASGLYLGCKTVPYWQTKIPTIILFVSIISLLVGIGIFIGTNGSIASRFNSVKVTNDLPF